LRAHARAIGAGREMAAATGDRLTPNSRASRKMPCTQADFYLVNNRDELASC